MQVFFKKKLFLCYYPNKKLNLCYYVTNILTTYFVRMKLKALKKFHTQQINLC